MLSEPFKSPIRENSYIISSGQLIGSLFHVGARSLCSESLELRSPRVDSMGRGSSVDRMVARD